MDAVHAENALPDPERPAGAATALSCAEIRELLSTFAENALPPALAMDIEAHLSVCTACLSELRALRAEDELLSDALSDLRPDANFRAKVAGMCAEVHRRAETVANTLPERGWAFFRWALALLAVVHFSLISMLLVPPAPTDEVGNVEALIDQQPWVYWANAAVFALALFLLIGGRLAAALESRLSNRLGGRTDKGPSRLEVLTLEALGICGVLATSVLHYLHLVR